MVKIKIIVIILKILANDLRLYEKVENTIIMTSRNDMHELSTVIFRITHKPLRMKTKMKLDSLRIFYNSLLKYLLTKAFLECNGSISCY